MHITYNYNTTLLFHKLVNSFCVSLIASELVFMIVISAFIVVLVFVLVKYKGTVCSPFTLLCVALVFSRVSGSLCCGCLVL